MRTDLHRRVARLERMRGTGKISEHFLAEDGTPMRRFGAALVASARSLPIDLSKRL